MTLVFACSHIGGCTFGTGGSLYPGPNEDQPWLCKLHAQEAWKEWRKKTAEEFYALHPEKRPKAITTLTDQKKDKGTQPKEKKETTAKSGLKRGAISEVTDRLLKVGGTISDIAKQIAQELNLQRDLEMNVTVRIYVLKDRGVKFEEGENKYFKMLEK